MYAVVIFLGARLVGLRLLACGGAIDHSPAAASGLRVSATPFSAKDGGLNPSWVALCMLYASMCVSVCVYYVCVCAHLNM